jgi:hypothetical protein
MASTNYLILIEIVSFIRFHVITAHKLQYPSLSFALSVFTSAVSFIRFHTCEDWTRTGIEADSYEHGNEPSSSTIFWEILNYYYSPFTILRFGTGLCLRHQVQACSGPVNRVNLYQRFVDWNLSTSSVISLLSWNSLFSGELD